MGIVTSFQNILDNVFIPLFEVTVNPNSHPHLHVFLTQVSCSAKSFYFSPFGSFGNVLVQYKGYLHLIKTDYDYTIMKSYSLNDHCLYIILFCIISWLVYLSLKVVGFDLVDDESRPERRPTKHMPKPSEWTNKFNPAYSYYAYYCYANLYVLNKVCSSISKRHKWSFIHFHICITSISLILKACICLKYGHDLKRLELHCYQ